MNRTFGLFLCVILLLASPATAQESALDFGVLVMAHGGDESWNAGVAAAVDSLDFPVPVELAFGMADRATLQEATRALEAAGVDRIVVLRLFISGESFLPQTRFLLGLDDTAPAFLMNGGHGGHEGPVPPVEHGSEIAIVPQGLGEAELTGTILAQRVAALSMDPAVEDVVLVAHGMGAEDANDRLLAALEARAEQVRADAAYRRVVVETLREDWTGKRQEAEARIRAAVASAAPGRALVVPVRLFGFGPYAEVLEGLQYEADGTGLLPSPLVAEWMRERVRETACGVGWLSGSDCATRP